MLTHIRVMVENVNDEINFVLLQQLIFWINKRKTNPESCRITIIKSDS